MTLDITNLRIAYPHGRTDKPAVESFSLSVGANERVAIVGESGSGKSTVANAIMGLLPGKANVSGSIKLDGTELIGLPTREWYKVRGAQIGYVPQDPMLSLNEVWTIGYHFRETISTHHLVSREDGRDAWRKLAADRLREVGLNDAERVLKQYPHQLSGGMRQRVLIALALLARPKLIIADEPTSALDVVVQKQILDLLEDLTDRLGSSLILITHDLGLVADRCTRVSVLYRGDQVETGSIDEVIRAPKQAYTKHLLEAVPKLSAIRDRKFADFTDAEKVLEIRHLYKEYPLKQSGWFFNRHGASILQASNDVNLTVRSGECRALVGESGSGKSTIAKIVMGLEKPTRGDVIIQGRNRWDIRGQELDEQAHHIQIVFQDPYASLDPQFTVQRTLLEPFAVHHRQWSADERYERILHLLELVGLDEDLLGRYPDELSGGQRQRVAIARALALEPEILVLDEAVSALDVIVRAQILETLRDLRERLGLSMLFITHDLAVVAEIADSVSVINHGRIVESGAVSDVFLNPQDDYTKELLASVPGRAAF
ncbi:dipeptide ABC transporter ATP-binding protein [Bifidobacterium biavatii]|uniref:ABC transporter ATP-binding protein n=1 Tax=Bifidobacterium biavatii DSM 23969 TaxID=1437608 RepID=A0A086ZVZ0_9BIFI|nr:ABC transporter ATP-binding protein [Bifidobacterium biavatii]KFI50690.1 ABC transporter ATP-binding protein [Bifidobacterium biavatii DSM 23969]